MSDDIRSTLNATRDDLLTLRDQVRVKAHLAGKDLEVFLDKQQKRVDAAQQRLTTAAEEAADHLPEVRRAAENLLDEVKTAFADARKRL